MTQQTASEVAVPLREVEVCSSNLRWRQGVLQQAWTIAQFQGLVLRSKKTVWRDVPVAPEDDDGADG